MYKNDGCEDNNKTDSKWKDLGEAMAGEYEEFYNEDDSYLFQCDESNLSSREVSFKIIFL